MTDNYNLKFGVDTTDIVSATQALQQMNAAAGITEGNVTDLNQDTQQLTSSMGTLQIQVQQSTTTVNNFNTTTNNTSHSLTQLGGSGGSGGATGSASSGFRNLRGIAGQAGFQLQDVAVQAQMGTDSLIILGQQGSQFAGAFGPTGAIVGAIIAVGAALAGVLSIALKGAEKDVKELTEEFKELNIEYAKMTREQKSIAIDAQLEKIKEAQDAADELKDKLKDLKPVIERTFEKPSSQYPDFIQDQIDAEAGFTKHHQSMATKRNRQAAKEYEEARILLQASLDNQTKIIADAEQEIIDIREGRSAEDEKREENRLSTIQQMIAKLTEQAAAQGESNKQTAIRQALLLGAKPEQVAEIARLSDKIELTKQQEKAEKELEKQRQKQFDLMIKEADALEKAAEQADKIETKALNRIIERSKSKQRLLKDQLDNELLLIANANDAKLDLLGGRNHLERMVRIAFNEEMAELDKQSREAEAKANQAHVNLIVSQWEKGLSIGQSVLDFFSQRQSQEIANLERQMDAIDKRADAEISAAENITKAERDEINKRANIEKQALERKAQAALEIQKKQALTSIAIDTGAGVMRALATGTDPVSKWLDVAAVLGAGAVQAAGVAGQQYGGGSSAPDIAPPANISNTNNSTTNNQNISFNVSGGSVEQIQTALTQFFDNDNVAFGPDSSQARVLNG